MISPPSCSAFVDRSGVLIGRQLSRPSLFSFLLRDRSPLPTPVHTSQLGKYSSMSELSCPPQPSAPMASPKHRYSRLTQPLLTSDLSDFASAWMELGWAITIQNRLLLPFQRRIGSTNIETYGVFEFIASPARARFTVTAVTPSRQDIDTSIIPRPFHSIHLQIQAHSPLTPAPS